MRQEVGVPIEVREVQKNAPLGTCTPEAKTGTSGRTARDGHWSAAVLCSSNACQEKTKKDFHNIFSCWLRDKSIIST